MTTTLKRAAAVLSAVLGLTLTIGGLWLATRVGTSSTATFTGKPQSAGAVLLTPQVLNRLDADVRITATAQGGGRRATSTRHSPAAPTTHSLQPKNHFLIARSACSISAAGLFYQ